MEHGQVDTESLQVSIRDLEIDDVQKSFAQPLVSISVSKSKTIWRYPVSYVQDVNNQPYELIREMGYGSCQANVASDARDQLSCGYVTIGGQMVEGSEGFCCSCSIGDLLAAENDRGGKNCQSIAEFFDSGDTAHCLQFDPLDWAVYNIAPPIATYDVNVAISLLDSNRTDDESSAGNVSDANQASSSTSDDDNNADDSVHNIQVSHTSPVARLDNPQVLVKLVGDLATPTQVFTMENKYLVIPARPLSHARVTPEAPMTHAMALDKHLFDLSGRSCDRIGVSYPAFQQDQADRCNRPQGSCLYGQPDAFFREDEERMNQSLSPLYNVRKFCPGSEWGVATSQSGASDVYLQCDWNSQRHTSIVRLEIAADDLRFITNVLICSFQIFIIFNQDAGFLFVWYQVRIQTAAFFIFISSAAIKSKISPCWI